MAADDLKPIETTYRGHRFRSRAEARWAIFFDALDVPYEYEKEGFDLDGRWYLPDFWLPSFGVWFEVKGVSPTPEEIDVAERLATASGKRVWIAIGPPANRDQIKLVLDKTETNTGLWQFMEDRRNPGEYWINSDGGWASHIGEHKGPSHDRYPIWSDRMQAALEKSRAARFDGTD